MINIKPSDIKGPLSRYQATKFEKNDFFQLITSINNALETPLEVFVLQNIFNVMWASLEKEANAIIEKYPEKNNKKSNMSEGKEQNEPIEEMLQFLRKQNTMLSNPDLILPMDYVERIFKKSNESRKNLSLEDEMFIGELINYFNSVVREIELIPQDPITYTVLRRLNLGELFRIVSHNARQKEDPQHYFQLQELCRRYRDIMNVIRNSVIDVQDKTIK